MLGASDGDDEATFLAALRSVFAPVANDAGSMIGSVEELEIARRVFAAFGDADGSVGLTRVQLADACKDLNQAVFTRRFEVMLHYKMLLPYLDKDHQHRYVFNLKSAPGLLVAERVAEHGGIDELLVLLDRTKKTLRNAYPDREEIRQSLVRARRMLKVAADYLTRLVTSSPTEDLLAERKHHNHAGLTQDVNALNELVLDEFPDLDGEAYQLVRTTQRYVEARTMLVDRLLDDRASSHDFTLLEPGRYLAAALTASPEALAEVFADVVFDPPPAWIRPSTLAAAALHLRPPTIGPLRPPRPPDPPPGPDPIELVKAKAARTRTRLELDATGYFADRLGDETELTMRMRSSTWPGLVAMLANLLAIDADQLLPYELKLDDQLLVDRDAGVSYMTPIVLRRLPQPSADPQIESTQATVGHFWDEDEDE